MEPGEDPFAAARREVLEETGIEDLQFDWGPVYQETAPYGSGKIARYYLGTTRAQKIVLPVSPELGRPEHHEGRWVGPEAALSLASPRLAPVVRWATVLVESR